MKRDEATVYDDDDLINSDEILRSLTHRAAYRTMITMRWILLPGSILLTQVVQDDQWMIAGYTLFAVFFLTALIFEVILAYDGVFKGVEELRKHVRMDKRTIVAKVIEIFINMIGLSLLISFLSKSDSPLLDTLIRGVGLGIMLSSMYLYRWRHHLGKPSH